MLRSRAMVAKKPEEPRETSKGELKRLDDLQDVVSEMEKTAGGPTINVNVLLLTVARKADSSEEALRHAQRALEIAKKWEDHNVEVFAKRTEALIDYKSRDPDEIEKRRNNRTRRCLKYVVAVCGVAGLGGMLGCVIAGASIVVTGIAGVLGAVCLASLAPLASGESVTSRDVVDIVRAMTSFGRRGEPREEDKPTREGSRRRKR